MGLPTKTDNIQGYEQAQLLNKVENIKNKMYYLIHGTLDDNVHYQQSLMLAKVLEQKDILFRQQVRPSRPPRSVALEFLSLHCATSIKERQLSARTHNANYFADLHG